MIKLPPSPLVIPRRLSATTLPDQINPLKFDRSTFAVLLSSATALYLLLNLVTASRYHNTYQVPLSESVKEDWDVLTPGDRLNRLVEVYNDREVEEEFGLKLGEVKLDDYIQDVQDIYSTYFTPTSPLASTTNSSLLATLLSALDPSLPSPPLETQPPFPRHIYTTAAPAIPDLPATFSTWSDLNFGWEVSYFSDEGIERFLMDEFGMGGSEGGWNTAGVGLLDEYRKLPRGVLKADFFRYLLMLLKGGVYADTDTAILKPLAAWPGLFPSTFYQSKNIFSQLPFSITPPPPLSIHSPRPSTSGIDSSPNLIIAIEKDALGEHVPWRGGDFTRGLQVYQWTLAARPGHPVFVDVLGRIMRTAREVREGRMVDPGALDFTGPAVYSDAVFRYLLSRWGVHPQQLVGLREPVRVGDVLILPRSSFQSPLTSMLRIRGPNELVWHGSHGATSGGWKSERKVLKEAAAGTATRI